MNTSDNVSRGTAALRQLRKMNASDNFAQRRNYAQCSFMNRSPPRTTVPQRITSPNPTFCGRVTGVLQLINKVNHVVTVEEEGSSEERAVKVRSEDQSFTAEDEALVTAFAMHTRRYPARSCRTPTSAFLP